MLKKRFIIILLLTISNTFSQEILKSSINSRNKENIYLHINSNFLISGEEILYSLYCLQENNKLSKLSKIAYVELIDKNNKSITKQKIRLKNGKGNGLLFLNANLKSGTYKLISYTNWKPQHSNVNRRKPHDNFSQY